MSEVPAWVTPEQQLRAEVVVRLEPFSALVGDETDGHAALQTAMADILANALVLTDRLRRADQPADGDGRDDVDVDFDALLASRTAEEIVLALWPTGAPPAEWWAAPLGRLVAGSYGPAGSDDVSVVVAAAMLGVTRGRVYQLVDAGRIERHPDGGVTRASVLRRVDVMQAEVTVGADSGSIFDPSVLADGDAQ